MINLENELKELFNQVERVRLIDDGTDEIWDGVIGQILLDAEDLSEHILAWDRNEKDLLSYNRNSPPFERPQLS